MAGKGGYQPPRRPAPVSGPGAMSQRTDGGPADQKARWIPSDTYGGASENMQLQQGAPMQGGQPPKATPLHAPTEHPNEPVTAGAPFGPGPGPAQPAFDPNADAQPGIDPAAAIIRSAYAVHPSPELGALMNYLETQGR